MVEEFGLPMSIIDRKVSGLRFALSLSITLSFSFTRVTSHSRRRRRPLRQVRKMKLISPTNREVDIGQTLLPNEYIGMTRREVLDTYLRDRAISMGTWHTRTSPAVDPCRPTS